MIYLMMIETENDKRKFVVLYEKYRYLLFKIAYDILRDDQLAEDAVHEAFVKIAMNMKKIEDVHTLRTKRYLITITKNAAIDIYRQRNKQRNKEIYMDELGESEMPYVSMEAEMDHRLLECLINLPVKYRDVFLLKYSSGYENAEIAKLLHISEDNVRQRILRGKKMIQEEIDGWEGSS